ncbi:hypothetical protein [Acidithiobacillus concretivorus]|uniref:hypothetical protein n=1 Tax=Acidithiobacillus concretivorus TaxID=3063952 RepID=UPI001C070797|nr:hypothetical protein [Acidithiobacillus concretivorus]
MSKTYNAVRYTSSGFYCDRRLLQGISKDKVLETVRIVRFAMATKIIGDAEPIFDALTGLE